MYKSNDKAATDFKISDDLWAVLEPLLPKRENTHRFGGGRPRISDRHCADAIFYVLRTGCPWDALTQTELCAKSTAHDRFKEWVAADVFLKLWRVGVERFDELYGLDWSWLNIDTATMKASFEEVQNGSLSKGCIKRSLLTDGNGIPIGVAVATANQPQMTFMQTTLDDIVGTYPELTDQQIQNMCFDKGYNIREIQQQLAERDFTSYIHSSPEEAQNLIRPLAAKSRIWRAERTHRWLNHFRRILVRREKKPKHYLAFLHFACALTTFCAAGSFR